MISPVNGLFLQIGDPSCAQSGAPNMDPKEQEPLYKDRKIGPSPIYGSSPINRRCRGTGGHRVELVRGEAREVRTPPVGQALAHGLGGRRRAGRDGVPGTVTPERNAVRPSNNYTYIYIYIYTYIYIDIYTHTYIHIHTYTYIHIYICIYIYIYICTFACLFVCLCVYTCIHTTYRCISIYYVCKYLSALAAPHVHYSASCTKFMVLRDPARPLKTMSLHRHF